MFNITINLLTIIMCFVNGYLAWYKGYNYWLFGLSSLLGWITALIIILCLPNKKENEL